MKQPSARTQAYLVRLETALRGIPKERRQEIVEEIAAHIDERVAASAEPDRGIAIRQALDELGDPETIAAETRERLGYKPVRWGAVEVAAVILLPLGAFIIPILGWIAGVVLLWISDVWTTRDKLIGTFVVPFGLAFPVALLLLSPVQESCEVGEVFKVGPRGNVTRTFGETVCETTGPPGWLSAVLLVVVVVGAIAGPIYLARKMKARSAPREAVA